MSSGFQTKKNKNKKNNKNEKPKLPTTKKNYLEALIELLSCA